MFAFGIDGNSKNITEREQSFYKYFLDNWGYLKSFSPSLPQQDKFAYSSALRMDGAFEGGGTVGALKLALFSAKQEHITEGWLTFSVGRELSLCPV